MICLAEIAKHVSGTLRGDGQFQVADIAPLESARPHHISFLSDKKKHRELAKTQAGAILIQEEVRGGPVNRVEVQDVYWAFAKVTELFAQPYVPQAGIHPTAVLDPAATVGEGACIGAHCVVAQNVRIGANTQLHHHVVVEDNVAIGDNCVLYSHVTVRKQTSMGHRVIIHSGAVIGSDGFGFAEKDDQYTKIHQLGWVEIQDDVEIGANTCIDRGALGPTVIRQGVKLDNLIHIAHNVEVGEHTGIAAQTGVSGSVKIGKHVKIAGQVGFVGHIQVGDRAFVGAQAGVSKSIPEGEVFTGTPARDAKRVRKEEAALASLPDWLKKFRQKEKET